MKTEEKFREGKFLVVRRDGTIPEWPHFVLGARDPAAPAALRAYARACSLEGLDREYVANVRNLAADFAQYHQLHGTGHADAPPHRRDDPQVIAVMRGHDGLISAHHIRNITEAFRPPPRPPPANTLHDSVNHPPHYQRVGDCPTCGGPIEAIDVTKARGFRDGNALKYLLRAGKKGPALEDLKKARWYIDHLVSELEAELAAADDNGA